MSWTYTAEALRVEVGALMVAASLPVEHLEGERHFATSRAAPYYIWVPRRLTAKAPMGTEDVDQARALADAHHIVDVHCVGRSYAEAHALANNLLKAVHAAAAADCSFETARWVDAGRAYNQHGQVLIMEIAINAPFVDAWVPVDLSDPVVLTAEIEGTEGAIYRSPDVDTDGELGLTVVNPEPAP